VYTFLLDNLEIYYTDTVQVLAELWSTRKATLFIFQDNRLINVCDVDVKRSPDETTYKFLQKDYNIKTFAKQPIFSKFDILMKLAKAIFLIRDKEETRGGEYVELLHALFQGHSNKVWFFKRNNMRLSAMLMEYLDKFRIKMRTYNDESDLKRAITRILKYELASQ